MLNRLILPAIFDYRTVKAHPHNHSRPRQQHLYHRQTTRKTRPNLRAILYGLGCDRPDYISGHFVYSVRSTFAKRTLATITENGESRGFDPSAFNCRWYAWGGAWDFRGKRVVSAVFWRLFRNEIDGFFCVWGDFFVAVFDGWVVFVFGNCLKRLVRLVGNVILFWDWIGLVWRWSARFVLNVWDFCWVRIFWFDWIVELVVDQKLEP